MPGCKVIGIDFRDLDLADQPPQRLPDTAAGPMVSVVIPAFNAAATLDQTLKSVRAQTHACRPKIVHQSNWLDAPPAMRHAAAEIPADPPRAGGRYNGKTGPWHSTLAIPLSPYHSY